MNRACAGRMGFRRSRVQIQGGLYLGAKDLAKIGYLFLKDGVWAGQRILPESWVALSVDRHVDDTAPENPIRNPGYGYQWWRLDRGGVEIWAGLGYGGQYLLIMPQHKVIGVVNSWNIFERQASILGPFINALLESARYGKAVNGSLSLFLTLPG